MKCRQIIDVLEKLAPPQLAESYDNVGLLVGDDKKDVKKIMIALDASKDVVSQAIDANVDMLITHHPMIFKGIKQVSASNFLGEKILYLAKNNIAYYASHTNMDNAVMSKIASDKLGLTNIKYIEPIGVSVDNNDVAYGTGRLGELAKEMSLKEFAMKVKKDLNISNIRVVGKLDKSIKKVAVIPGSGKSYLSEVLQGKADVFLTGDIDHHIAIDVMDMDFALVDGGHFDTERFFVEFVKEYLMNKLDSEHLEIVLAIEEGPFIYL